MKTRNRSLHNLMEEKTTDKRSLSLKHIHQPKRKPGAVAKEVKKTIQYSLINKSQIKVDGVVCYKSSTRPMTEKGVATYFSCSGRRLKNKKAKYSCYFSGKVINFDPAINIGEILVIKDHNDECPKNIFESKNANIEGCFEKMHLNKDDNPENTQTCSNSQIRSELFNYLNNHQIPSNQCIRDFVKSNIPLGFQLKESQIKDIWRTWKKENSILSDDYCLNYPYTLKNLPFFRLKQSFYYKYKNKEKTGKIIIWASEMSLNRLRLSNHFYVDGTFGTVPRGFKQLITIMIHDPNTNMLGPGAFCLVNFKNHIGYSRCFSDLIDITTQQHKLEWIHL